MSFLLLLMLVATAQCGEGADLIQQTQCAKAKLELAEADLNREFESSLHTARINDRHPRPNQPSYEEQLRNAQKAWLAFREVHCQSLILIPMARYLDEINGIWCRTRLAEQRRAQLAETRIYD